MFKTFRNIIFIAERKPLEIAMEMISLNYLNPIISERNIKTYSSIKLPRYMEYNILLVVSININFI